MGRSIISSIKVFETIVLLRKRQLFSEYLRMVNKFQALKNNFFLNMIFIELLWRNRLARSAVNRKVGGSSTPRSENSRNTESDFSAEDKCTKLSISK